MSRSTQQLLSGLSVVLMLGLFLPLNAFGGHPISVTETQIYVTRTNARARIKLFAEDLYLFHELEPDAGDIVPPAELQRGLKLHRQFLLDKVTLRDAKGDAFPGNVVDVQPFEIPESGIAVDDLMLHTATYEIEFPFQHPPEFLTIQQDITDANFIFPSEMKMTLHQAGTELTYRESLRPGAAQTIRFDWDQAALTEDATDEDWNKWFEKQREATLGITSYSSVYSFIYVEPGEVRHEVLIPLANLKKMLPLQHEDPAFVEVDEQEPVRGLIRDWLASKNPTLINGANVSPEFTRIDFYGLDLTDFAKQAEDRRVSLANGRVGVIMTYHTNDDAVKEVSLSWDTYNSSLRKIQSVVFAYPNTLSKFEFSRFNPEEENKFHWAIDPSEIPDAIDSVPAQIPPLPKLPVPIASVVLAILAGAVLIMSRSRNTRIAISLLILSGVMWPFARTEIPHPYKAPTMLPEEQASEIFQQLHSGTYRALDYGSQNRIYEALSKSIDGELLETVYLQLRESLEMRDQGGAVARVREVDYTGGELLLAEKQAIPWPGFQYRSQWAVKGTVEHWGHIHERQNRFNALFTVEPHQKNWKITEMQVESLESLPGKTHLRKF